MKAKSLFENSKNTSFFAKKEAKKLSFPAGRGNAGAKSHVKRKFFASFFQKRSPFLNSLRAFEQHSLFLKEKTQNNIGCSQNDATARPKPAIRRNFLLAPRGKFLFKKQVLACLALLIPLTAHATNLATAPIGRMDLGWWQTRFTQTLDAKKADPNAKIIWLGDSITQFWQRQGTRGWDNILPVWDKYYAPYNALDFGFVGDTTASLIWRLDHGQVSGLHPDLAIILIGANNLGHPHWGAEMTVPGIEAVVSKTETLLPTTHIILLGVLPSIRSPWVDQQTKLINAALGARYRNNQTVSFLDVSPVLTQNGKTDASLYIDPKQTPPKPALHPDATGMSRIAAFIAPVVREYVK